MRDVREAREPLTVDSESLERADGDFNELSLSHEKNRKEKCCNFRSSIIPSSSMPNLTKLLEKPFDKIQELLKSFRVAKMF